MKDRTNYRIVIDFNDYAVSRIRIKERDRDGKYVRLERRWGVSDLAALKLAARAVTLASRGVADLGEVCRTANTARRRKLALQTGRTAPGSNVHAKGVAQT